MVTKVRGLAVTLWVMTLACFAVGWLYTNRIASTVGCATLVLYMGFAAQARSLSLSSTHQDADDRVARP